jgi:hypothetical protein
MDAIRHLGVHTNYEYKTCQLTEYIFEHFFSEHKLCSQSSVKNGYLPVCTLTTFHRNCVVLLPVSYRHTRPTRHSTSLSTPCRSASWAWTGRDRRGRVSICWNRPLISHGELGAFALPCLQWDIIDIWSGYRMFQFTHKRARMHAIAHTHTRTHTHIYIYCKYLLTLNLCKSKFTLINFISVKIHPRT